MAKLRIPWARELEDLRWMVTTISIVGITWLLLGSSFTYPITHGDGPALVMPYVQSALHAGTDWQDHLYRFSTIGGSKMHEFGGTMPIVQLAAALGLSVTTTVNLITLFIQVCVGFMSLKAVTALVALWVGRERRLSMVERISTISLASFAPMLGWRLAYGHENLLLGLLPVLSAVTLLWCARAKALTITSVVFAAFAIANGVSGLGAQTVIYSAIFVTPFAIAIVLDAPRGERWGVREWSIVAAVMAGVLLMLPRVSMMIAHATGADASRALDEPVTYSFGEATWIDWVTSIPWTSYFARTLGGATSIHEHNYPVGPLVLFVLLLWPRDRSRRILWALLAGIALAILFANNIAPISSGLLAVVRPLAAFRVPARAIMPLLVFLPILALASLWSASANASEPRWRSMLGVAVAMVLLLAAPYVPAAMREAVAWLGCVAIVLVARFARHRLVRWPLPLLAALGVMTFHARFPADDVEPIERGPRQLHDGVVSRAPDLRSALDRVVIVDPPRPYGMSTAWAAQLPSIDGVWYPPRRFLDLLGALDGNPLPPTTCAFQLGQDRNFVALAQLYNVRYALRLTGERPGLMRTPPTRGGAWFPDRVQMIEDAATMGTALRGAPPTAVQETAWLLHRDHATIEQPQACKSARVLGIDTDLRGQAATLRVESPAACVLVVSANYVSTFVAQANGSRLDVFPIDLALTGILVSAGASTITLEPIVIVPLWAWIGFAVGLLLLVAACVGVTKSR